MVMVFKAFGLPALALLVKPFVTSQNNMFLALSSAAYVPSRTSPKPPLIAFPQPVPPPLCKDTQLAPLIASPITFYTAMSAVNDDPS
jgi:hypothetical protein